MSHHPERRGGMLLTLHAKAGESQAFVVFLRTTFLRSAALPPSPRLCECIDETILVNAPGLLLSDLLRCPLNARLARLRFACSLRRSLLSAARAALDSREPIARDVPCAVHARQPVPKPRVEPWHVVVPPLSNRAPALVQREHERIIRRLGRHARRLNPTKGFAAHSRQLSTGRFSLARVISAPRRSFGAVFWIVSRRVRARTCA